MPTQIGLINGTMLVVANDQEHPDDVIQKLGRAGDFVVIDAADGDYRIRPEHVTYIRWVDEPASPRARGLK